MLICDWCGEKIHDDDNVARLKIECSCDTRDTSRPYSPRSREISSGMTFHEHCGIRALYASTEAIEDYPVRERPEPSDEDILYHIPVLTKNRMDGDDGPAGDRLRLSRHLGDGAGERPTDALHRAGLESLLDLAFQTRADISAIPGVGETTLRRLEIALRRHGLRFASEVEAHQTDKGAVR